MKKIALYLSAILLLASCYEISVQTDDAQIDINPMLATSTKASSAGPIAGTTFDTGRTIWLSAYYTDAESTSHSQNYFTDIPYTYYSTSSKWAAGTQANPQTKYWPSRGRMDFIALSREGTASGWTGLSGISHTGSNPAASVTYVMPDNSSNQDDITASHCYDVNCAAHAPVPMEFKHLQAQVRFTARLAAAAYSGSYGITVNSITLRRARYSGTVTYTGSTGGISWSGVSSGTQTSVAAGTSDLNLSTTAVQYGKGIVLPEQSPTGSAGGIDVLIQYTLKTPEAKQLSYVYTIPATTWLPGKKYTYAFSFSLNEIVCSPTVTGWNDGGTENITLPEADYLSFDILTGGVFLGN